MNEEAVRADLIERFPGIEEEGLIECVSICKIFNKVPEDLRYKWEALIYNSSNKDQPISFFTANSARDLRKEFQREVAKESQKTQTAKASVARRGITKNLGSLSSPLTGRTRMVAAVKREPTTPSLSGRSKVVAGRPITFASQDSELFKYRYMHEKVHDRASILDEQIDAVAELVRQHYKLEELGDPSTVTLDDVIVVGRIVNDGDTKLGETSTLLESSRMMGMGARISLEFDTELKIRCASRRGTGSTGFDLFPGMIVALKGKNGSGDSFVVSEILRLPPLPSTSKPEPNVSLRAVIACGPFTFDSDLDYKPFGAITEAARNEEVDLLLLIGPFVDSNHPLIRSGQVDLTPTALFNERIAKSLAQLEADMPELVVALVPSPRDLISSHIVLPQAALERDPGLGLSRKCQLLSNPTTFSINGFTLGVISIDVLFHIRKDCFSKQAPEIADEPNTESADAMTMLCRQVLEQRSFYPLFPVPREVHEEVNLSVVHSDLLKIKGTPPDILILPSRLKEFQKVVNSTVIVNPALAAKFNSAGSAVCFTITRDARGGIQHGMKVVKLGA